MLLKGKVAIITGGAKGIGKGMALKFADEGCTVAIADINMDEANKVIAEINKKGQKGIAIKCDITDGKQIRDVVEQVASKFGRIDILANNAGGIPSSPPIEDMTEEEWDGVFAFNLRSQFLFCKYVVPHMKKQKYGKIINLSSIGGIQPPHHAIHYNTAKAAIIGFTYDLGRELAPLNITVNAILPGPVRTNFYDKTTGSMSDKEKDDFFAGLGVKVPMKRAAAPEELANAALFLASDLSSYVTCDALLVSGGLPQLP